MYGQINIFILYFYVVYIDHRKKMIRNKTKFELKEAEDREHIIQGLLVCLKNLEEIVELIKKSREGILEKLMDKFKLSKKQTEAILELKFFHGITSSPFFMYIVYEASIIFKHILIISCPPYTC
jgi:hypothetical protein